MNPWQARTSKDAARNLDNRRIGVIYGGPSGEREVSLQSGAAVANALEGAGVNAVRLLVDDAADTVRKLDREAIDAAFIALHGFFGEDGGVQRILDARQIPYTGCGALSSRVCIDKAATKRVVQASGFSTPRYEIVREEEWRRGYAAALAERIGYPLVTKPNHGGSSLGVSIVREPGTLENAMKAAFSHDTTALLEAFVEGREFTVGILDGSALPVVEVRAAAEFYDYEAKYIDDATRYICPAQLDPVSAESARAIAEMVFERLRCRDLARIDFILPARAGAGSAAPHGGIGNVARGESGDEMPVDAIHRQMPQLIEVNTIPGFTSHSLLPKAAQAAGISFADLCCRLAAMAVRRGARAARPLRRAG